MIISAAKTIKMASTSFFVPEISDFPVVDVRDVAEALLLVYEKP